MKRIRVEDSLLHDEPALKTQCIVPKIYTNTVIDGNATAILGDNHGNITNLYGDHHYHLPQSREEVISNRGKSEGDEADQGRLRTLLASLAFDNMGARLRNVGTALSTTCQWFRNHESFVSWLDDDRSKLHDLLWLKGKPGSGKSTIMRETLHWMTKNHPEQTVISYFFDARSPYRLAKSTLGMYQALLHQLLSARPNTHGMFLEEFSAKIVASKVESWSETEIQNFMMSLADTKNTAALTIFIDALDEDDGDDVQQMVDFFEDLQGRATSSGGRLRVCLSSRHYPHLTIRGAPIILEEQRGHEEDISKYISIRLLGEDSHAKSELQQKIVRKAASVFLWIILIIHILNQEHNRGKGLASMYQELDRAPEKVQDLFRAILTKEEGNKEECITLLRWVLFTERPLRPSELYVAVRHVRPGDMNQKPKYFDYDKGEVSRYLLNCSRGLVELTKASPPTVQLIHETVRELLLNTSVLESHVSALPATLQTSLDVQAQICHAMISEFCLTYLCDFYGMKQRRGTNYHMRDYAVEYCWQHLEKTADPYRSSSVEVAHRLLSSCGTMKFWELCVLSLKGCARRSGIEEYLILHKIYDQPLCRAIVANVPELVRTYVVAGADITSGSREMTALGVAISMDKTNMVKLLLDLGADPNAMQPYPILTSAVKMQNTKVVRMLLEAGAFVDVDRGGITPLINAASLGHKEIVELLLDWGAIINLEGPDSNLLRGSPLANAARAGHKDVANILIRRGADVRLGDVSYSPLGAAAMYGHSQIVELLLKHGAPIEYGGRNYGSPLELAKSDHHGYDRNTVRILLGHGARPDSPCPE